MRDAIHVMPINDLKEHEQSSCCPCRPRIEEKGHLIVHRSWDRREHDEQAATTCKRAKVDQ